MDTALIEGKIRDYIDRSILQGQGADLTPSTSLFDLGILDSFALFGLVAYIADEFQVTVPLESVTAEHFKDIAAIARVVQSLKAGSAASPP